MFVVGAVFQCCTNFLYFSFRPRFGGLTMASMIIVQQKRKFTIENMTFLAST